MKGARRPIDDEELARDIKVHSFGCKGKVVINNCTTTSEQRLYGISSPELHFFLPEKPFSQSDA